MDPLKKETPGRRERNWTAMLDLLGRYRDAHGDCRVPYPCPEEPRLAHWVKNQRLLRRNGALSRDRVAALDRIGFEWDGRIAKSGRESQSWERMFRALAHFSRVHGHSGVPHRWREQPGLGVWVRRQRQLHASGRLEAARVRRLNSLRFEWIGTEAKEFAEDRRWDATLDLLLAWRRTHPDRIPPARGEHGALAHWLGRQRRARDAGRLSARRLHRLRQAGLLAATSAARRS